MYDYIQSETAAKISADVDGELAKITEHIAGGADVMGNVLAFYAERVQKLQGAQWVCMIVDTMLENGESNSAIIERLNGISIRVEGSDLSRQAMSDQAQSMIAPFSARISDSVQK